MAMAKLVWHGKTVLYEDVLAMCETIKSNYNGIRALPLHLSLAYRHAFGLGFGSQMKEMQHDVIISTILEIPN